MPFGEDFAEIGEEIYAKTVADHHSTRLLQLHPSDGSDAFYPLVFPNTVDGSRGDLGNCQLGAKPAILTGIKPQMKQYQFSSAAPARKALGQNARMRRCCSL